MNWCRTACLLLSAVLWIGCDKTQAPAQGSTNAPPANRPAGRPQPKLPTVTLWLGANKEIVAEIARTSSQVQTGMMFRESMGENEGMLFVFGNVSQRAFWMKNTLLPLSVAYIDPDGKILEIHEMQPGNETPVVSKSYEIQFVLEMPQAWFERNKIAAGTVIRTEHGTFKETFFRQR
jgi:uncharacterized membrane protein (UPF0127 family)